MTLRRERSSKPCPNCQYHGLSFLRVRPDMAAALKAAGWRDTKRHGWVCPTCLAKYPDLLRLTVRA